MRVLYVNPGVARHGGAERALLGLLDGLEDATTDIEVRVLVFGDGDLASVIRERGHSVGIVTIPGAFRPTARYEGAAGIFMSAASAVPGLWPAIRQIRAEAQGFDADIVHSNGGRAHVLAPFVRGRWSTVATLHDLPQTGLERAIMSVALRRVDGVLANSPMVARHYGAGVGCRVVDNAVPTPTARDRAEARSRFGLPAEAFVIASLSHFHWYKGQLDLVEAMGRLDEGCHLLLTGGPLYGQPSHDYLQRVSAAAAASPAAPRIHFTGAQDDVSWVYAAGDVVAHCSVRPEPFGMAIVEALLAGTAVLASATGTPAEMLHHGRTAMLYPPGQVADLARSLVQLRSDTRLRGELARNGREWAAERFAPRRHARAVLAVYDELIEARRHRRRPWGNRRAPVARDAAR